LHKSFLNKNFNLQAKKITSPFFLAEYLYIKIKEILIILVI